MKLYYKHKLIIETEATQIYLFDSQDAQDYTGMKIITLAVLALFNATPTSNVVDQVENQNTSPTTETVSLKSAPRGIQG